VIVYECLIKQRTDVTYFLLLLLAFSHRIKNGFIGLLNIDY